MLLFCFCCYYSKLQNYWCLMVVNKYSYRMCAKIKKYVKILLLEFLNEDHILQFFSFVQRTFLTNCKYEGCLLYFGIREQKQILIIEDLYTFVCVWTNYRSTFAWGISKICILNASTASSSVEKRWPLIFYVRCYSVPSQDYTGDDSSNRCFECSKMQLFEPRCGARFVVVKSNPFSSVGFSDFLEDHW